MTHKKIFRFNSALNKCGHTIGMFCFFVFFVLFLQHLPLQNLLCFVLTRKCGILWSVDIIVYVAPCNSKDHVSD